MNLEEQVEGLGDASLETEILETMLKAEKKGKASSEAPKLETDAGGAPHFLDKPPTIFHVLPDGKPVGHVLSHDTYERYTATLLPERAMLLERYRLADTAFNACKSDVKLLDYAALRLLPVVADGAAYAALKHPKGMLSFCF